MSSLSKDHISQYSMVVEMYVHVCTRINFFVRWYVAFIIAVRGIERFAEDAGSIPKRGF